MELVRPLLLSITAATRLLIVSPHPDDGALAAAGLVSRVVRARGSVEVVQMTSGDAFSEGVKKIDRTDRPTPDDYRAYGLRRERETIAAMGTLGVPASQITFLGFPDDGLCLLSSAYSAVQFESPYTRRRSPPDGERLLDDVGYRGRDVVRELQQIIARFKPTIVVIPAPADEHPDHCSTHRFVTRALGDRPSARVLHYVIHGRQPDRAEALALTRRETAAKRRAIEAYRSQTLIIGDFMRKFENGRELFVEDDPSPLPPCWCRDENIAKP
ncbi:MAG TPA: PIG-L family deacetylase [Vicinamibacterales bacterium]|nr:PIG-L family deacetylase [Vicinamibacterales bacterium]